LLAGHNPGEADDRASLPEIAAARKKLAFLMRQAGGYRWEPFRKVDRPRMPIVKKTAWGRNPIDAVIPARPEDRGLKPRREAPPEVLLRRLYLDLIGLPPTPEELNAFMQAHGKPSVGLGGVDPYEEVVDRLLASPQYGERWGRHWMDVWRYSD